MAYSPWNPKPNKPWTHPDYKSYSRAYGVVNPSTQYPECETADPWEGVTEWQ